MKTEDEVSFEDGMAREPFELSFNYDTPVSCGGEEEFVKEEAAKLKKKKKKTLLSLNYEAIIAAWASQGSPWTSGSRPDFDPEECWPDCMGNGGTEFQHRYSSLMGKGGQTQAMGDGGREARVSRYREKRRRRLFSKKIRYEVRKVNAEKRPRMKGRFVKRSSFLAAFPLHAN